MNKQLNIQRRRDRNCFVGCLVVLGERGRKWINISFRYVDFEMLEKIFNWKFLADKWNSQKGAQVKRKPELNGLKRLAWKPPPLQETWLTSENDPIKQIEKQSAKAGACGSPLPGWGKWNNREASQRSPEVAYLSLLSLSINCGTRLSHLIMSFFEGNRCYLFLHPLCLAHGWV